MSRVFFTPPLAFIVYLLIAFLISKMTTLLSSAGKDSPGKEKAYACGENVADHRAQPDYGQFFPFAFLFTIMHVIALIIATVPFGLTILPAVYLIVALVSIFILFRR